MAGTTRDIPPPPPQTLRRARGIALDDDASWWSGFDDPLLGQLATQVLQANLDLQLSHAVARMEENGWIRRLPFPNDARRGLLAGAAALLPPQRLAGRGLLQLREGEAAADAQAVLADQAVQLFDDARAPLSAVAEVLGLEADEAVEDGARARLRVLILADARLHVLQLLLEERALFVHRLEARALRAEQEEVGGDGRNEQQRGGGERDDLGDAQRPDGPRAAVELHLRSVH